MESARRGPKFDCRIGVSLPIPDEVAYRDAVIRMGALDDCLMRPLAKRPNTSPVASREIEPDIQIKLWNVRLVLEMSG